MKEEIKKAAEEIINKKIEWLHKRAERAVELETTIFLNKFTAMVGTSLEDENHYYKVCIKPGHEDCGCKDWKYRGKTNGIPCKHMIRVMAERVVRDQEAKAIKETKEILKEADEAVRRGELPVH